MSLEECDALQCDLDAAGVQVLRIEEPAPGVFWLVYHSDSLNVDYTVTSARLFRETWAAGLHEELPPKLNAPTAPAAAPTRVVNLQHEPYDVYIGRSMPGLPGRGWGNPFYIGRDGTREEVIARYRDWIKTQPALLARLEELRGKRLGCWCKPEPCHGDVLVLLLGE
jgi:hypothetical protein